MPAANRPGKPHHEQDQDMFRSLLETTRFLTASMDLDARLEKITTEAMRISASDRGVIFLLDENRELLIPRCAIGQGVDYDDIMALRLKPGEGLTGNTILKKCGLISNWNRHHDLVLQVDGTAEEEDESIISVPLLLEEDPIGAITLSKAEFQRYTEHELDILTLFANLAAATIDNARLYNNLKKAYRDLKENQSRNLRTEKLRALGDMASGVAHEFNNLLGVVLGHAQIARQTLQPHQNNPTRQTELTLDQAEADTRLGERLERIIEAVMKGTETVRRLQELSGKRIDQPAASVNLAEVVRQSLESLEELRRTINQRQEIHIHCQTELMDVRVASNHSELVEAVTHLIQNAIEACSRDSVIRIYTKMENQRGVLVVKDPGRGIAAKNINRVFDPFFSTKVTQGSGLGLAIVHNTIHRYHGEIKLNSRLNQGTEFRISLPLLEEVSGDRVISETGQPLSLLVVDDDAAIRELMVEILEGFGHQVFAAASGSEALELYFKQRIDIVFTDLGMPGMDGFEVSRRIRAHDPDIPIIMVTGWGLETTTNRAVEAGVNRILSKPVRIEDMEAVLQEFTH